MPFTINHATPVLFGEGVSGQTGENLQNHGVKKVLCVYDQGLKSAGIADKIIRNIKDCNIEVAEFDGVQPDPPIESVDEAGELARSENVDAVVGIGGGSSLDTAKAVNVMLGNPGSIKKYLDMEVPQKPGKIVFAIPTTAGTGSEVCARLAGRTRSLCSRSARVLSRRRHIRIQVPKQSRDRLHRCRPDGSR